MLSHASVAPKLNISPDLEGIINLQLLIVEHAVVFPTPKAGDIYVTSRFFLHAKKSPLISNKPNQQLRFK